MPTRARRKDTNQATIERGLKELGISYFDTSALGRGFVDLVVGYEGKNYQYEIKDTTTPAKALKMLTEKEQAFSEGWKGHYKVVTSLEQILDELGVSYQ